MEWGSDLDPGTNFRINATPPISMTGGVLMGGGNSWSGADNQNRAPVINISDTGTFAVYCTKSENWWNPSIVLWWLGY